jgi:hypothetical protein
MARASLDCPGSWLPGHGLHPGDDAFCSFCGQVLQVAAPPTDEAHDPSRGSSLPRIPAHVPKAGPTQ